MIVPRKSRGRGRSPPTPYPQLPMLRACGDQCCTFNYHVKQTQFRSLLPDITFQVCCLCYFKIHLEYNYFYSVPDPRWQGDN